MKKLLLLVLLITAFALPAQALTFSLDTPLPEDPGLKPTPGGEPPWLTATFEDTADGVLLTLEADLKEGNIVTEWYFNLAPSLNPAELVFEHVDGDAPLPNAINHAAQNIYNADGVSGHEFDIFFDFPPPPGQLEFESTESISYLITGPQNLSAASFDYLNKDGLGDWHSVAHIQQLSDGGSTWIGDGNGYIIPEPSTLLLLGTGLFVLLGLGKKFRQ